MTMHAEELLLADLIARPSDAPAALDLSVKSGWLGCKFSWLDKDRAEGRPKPGRATSHAVAPSAADYENTDL